MASDSIAANRYNEAALAHFRNPEHAGLPASTGMSWFTATVGKRAQGCEFTLAARVEASTLAELRFAAFGCPHAIAAADWACGQLEGQTVETLRAFRGLELQQPLALPAEKLPVLLLLEDALHTLADTITPQK